MNKILGRIIGFAEPWFLPFNASLENSGGGPGVYYYIDDVLGSSRTIVQDGQTSACYEADFYPFGGERDINVSCVQNYKFEGKERDPETQNDDFGARYYSNRFGRWLSADWSSVPEPVPYANLSNPQTLNLYGMVSDNPETFADLDGHLGCGFLWLGTCQQTPPPSPPTRCGITTRTGSCKVNRQWILRRLTAADEKLARMRSVLNKYDKAKLYGLK